MSLRYLGGIIKPSYNPLAANVTVSPTVVQTGGVYTLQQQAQAQGQQQWSHDPYFNNTTLLLHADNFVNGSQNNTFLVTPPRGVGQYTGYFNGSASVITPSSSNLQFGTGDFSMEFWALPSSATSGSAMGSFVQLVSPGDHGFIISHSSGVFSAFYKQNNSYSYTLTNPTASSTGVWHWIVVCRVGTNVALFVDGVRGATTTDSTSIVETQFAVGRHSPSGYGANNWNGYLSNVRIIKGSSPYDPTQSTITIPTSPLIAITNTQLLTCQSATIVDSSPNNFTLTNNGPATVTNPNAYPTVTRNGTPTQGTFTPYGDVWSNYFNGSTDYISPPSTLTATGDFTLEWWSYLATSTVSSYIIPFSTGTGLCWVGWMTNINTFAVNDSSGGVINTSLMPYVTNRWAHIAISKSGTSIKLFVDGNLIASGTSSNSFTFNRIGCYGTNQYNYTGYLSNVRFVNGTALYTSSFVPGTAPLTAVTNTALLTCQSNRFADASSNNYAITPAGSISVQRFAPFSPSSGYSPSVYSGSGYFASTSTDYLSVASGSGVNLTTNNFTFDCWFYKITDPANAANLIWWNGNTNLSSYAGLRLQIDTARTITLLCSESGSAWQVNATSTATYNNNAWNHIAVVRNGATVTAYLNGVSVASGSLSSSSASLYAGTLNYINNMSFSSGTWSMIGYVSDTRLVNGTAVYTGAFTPPAAPLTAVTNTSLLLSYTNAGVYDNGMMNNWTTVLNAQASTSILKYGSGSMYFDGGGACVQNPIPFNTMGAMSGDFTIECWVNWTVAPPGNASGNERQIIGQQNWPESTSGNWWCLLGVNVGLYYYAAGGGSYDLISSSSFTWTTGQWYHVAVTRSGSTVRIFLNGTQVGSGTSTKTLIADNTRKFSIGADGNASQTRMNGYIDDVRITKGVARYVSNFTPPQVGMANQ